MACEQFRDGLVGQPAGAATALALVLAGLLILAGRRPAQTRARWSFGLLVVAVGVGSVIQHGPHPPWQAYPHDLSLAAVLAFVAADAAADLTGRVDDSHPLWARWRAGCASVALPRCRGRSLQMVWWLVPTAAMAPVVAAGPVTSSAAQTGLAVVAIGLSLWRTRVRPGLRRRLLVALAILAAGAIAGTLGERTSLCQPDSLLQGHAIWHLLAALALWWLAPAIGQRAGPGPAGGATLSSLDGETSAG